MNRQSINWIPLSNLDDLDQAIEHSRTRPVLVLKHQPTSIESIKVKNELDANWQESFDQIGLYIVDPSCSDVAAEVSNLAGIDHLYPQVVLFADGVTMYDESNDLISSKKIKLALKIVNRTFRWMETRA